MSVIIRLQNLPWSANALDIRHYFDGLSIPEGGVHIVGGELGDAFIAFSTDEDARLAFQRNNGKIKEVQISLMLSSRTEMQGVIEKARAKSYAAYNIPAAPVINPSAISHSTLAAQMPLPAAVPILQPAVVPSAVPETKKESKGDKKERRRSRSKSRDRDRRDRSRDRDRKDRRYRDRSRSRSRDRKARRRNRSRSRDRSRSRERRRREDKSRKSDDKDRQTSLPRDSKKQLPEVWANNTKPTEQVVQPNLLSAFNLKFEPSLATGNLPLQTNNLDLNMFNGPTQRNVRESWPPTNQNNFTNRSANNFPVQNNFDDNRYSNNKYQRNAYRNLRDSEEGCCVELEPFYGAYGDVRKFFHGMFISNRGIKFINDVDGRRTGITYIQFGDKQSKQDALTLNGRELNGLKVAIRHLDDEDFNQGVDRFIPSRMDDEEFQEKFRSRNITKYFNKNSPKEEDVEELTDYCCLTVEDLPSYCKEQDILHIFALHPLVALILTNRRRSGPIAYVKFGSQEAAKKAYEDKDNHIVGGKLVTVKPCKDEDFEEINKQNDIAIRGPKTDGVRTNCLNITKLPPKTTDKDIADFFSDIGVVPNKIHLMSNNQGFTGQAFCEFATHEEASKALKKNEASLGNATISVQLIEREDMNTILDTTVQTPEPVIPPKKLEIIPPTHNSIRNEYGPPRRMFFSGRNFSNNHNFRGPRFGMNPRVMGMGRMRFPIQQEVEEAPPGCTVYMKNVPYKAGTDDILNFFADFNHTSNVSRRYNPNNTPSDEAKIFFFEPEEASRAVEELQKKKIWDRQIFLRQE